MTVFRSAFGNYALGPQLSGAWTGFSDAASGIAGYYVSLTNGAGGTNGLWTASSSASVAAALDQTNTFYVWARDQAGLIGGAAAAAVLVLDPAGDRDGDGMQNGAEEVAGTDAANPASVLKFRALSAQTTNGVSVSFQWNSVTGRFYSLSFTNDVPGTVVPLAPISSFQRMPGTGGTMTFEDAAPSGARRFYRLSVDDGGP